MSRSLGEENAQRLEDFLNDLAARKEIVPDATAVAAACGFDRGVLYKNTKCRILWEGRIRPATEFASPPLTRYSRKDQEQARRIRDLEQKNADLTERLIKAEAELSRLRPFELVYEHTAATGKDITL